MFGRISAAPAHETPLLCAFQVQEIPERVPRGLLETISCAIFQHNPRTRDSSAGFHSRAFSADPWFLPFAIFRFHQPDSFLIGLVASQ